MARGGRRNWLWWFESGGKSLLEERESGKEKMRENKLCDFFCEKMIEK